MPISPSQKPVRANAQATNKASEKQRRFAQRMGCGEHCTALLHPDEPCQCQASRCFFQKQR